MIDAFVHAHQIERLVDAGQHAERQHVDLHQAEHVDIVLIPFDEGAILHGGVTDRHDVIEALARQHEAADVLREMAREAEDARRKCDGAADQRIFGIEPRLAQMHLRDR